MIPFRHQGGALITAHVPTLARHYHPESIVELGFIHPLCYTFCRFGQMYDDVSPP